MTDNDDVPVALCGRREAGPAPVPAVEVDCGDCGCPLWLSVYIRNEYQDRPLLTVCPTCAGRRMDDDADACFGTLPTGDAVLAEWGLEHVGRAMNQSREFARMLIAAIDRAERRST